MFGQMGGVLILAPVWMRLHERRNDRLLLRPDLGLGAATMRASRHRLGLEKSLLQSLHGRLADPELLGELHRGQLALTPRLDDSPTQVFGQSCTHGVLRSPMLDLVNFWIKASEGRLSLERASPLYLGRVQAGPHWPGSALCKVGFDLVHDRASPGVRRFGSCAFLREVERELELGVPLAPFAIGTQDQAELPV